MVSWNELEFREKRVKEYFKLNSLSDFLNQREIIDKRILALSQEKNRLETLKEDLFHDIGYYSFIAWTEEEKKEFIRSE